MSCLEKALLEKSDDEHGNAIGEIGVVVLLVVVSLYPGTYPGTSEAASQAPLLFLQNVPGVPG
eukprot:3933089-Rhodomonas_salina.1